MSELNDLKNENLRLKKLVDDLEDEVSMLLNEAELVDQQLEAADTSLPLCGTVENGKVHWSGIDAPQDGD